jgi:hypothetical protein
MSQHRTVSVAEMQPSGRRRRETRNVHVHSP